MPNPWKRSSRTPSFSRLVSALRPKRPSPDSPLLVQTGFPTSLADLVVKHRSRLRKKKDNHSHKPHTHPPPPSPSPSRFGSRVSEIISVVEDFSSTPSENDHDDDHDELSSTQMVDGGGSTHKADAFHSTEIIADEDATSTGLEERADLGTRSGGAVPASVITTPGRGLGCQAKVVLVMALAVSTRELVLGVMLSAFSLLLLESLGAWALAWARRRGERRELEPPQTLGSEKGDIPDSGFDPRSAVSPERSNLGKVGSWKGDEVAVKAKRRRWAKAMKEKLRPSTRGKDAKEAGSDAGGGGGGGVEEGGGELEQEEEEAVEEGEEEEGGGVDEVCGVEKKYNSNGRSRHLHHHHVLLLVVVLSGLVRGKVVALVITVASCYLMKMAGFVASNRRSTRRIPTSCSVA